MSKVIQINLSNMKSKELVYKYTLYDKDNNKTYIDNLEIYELNIEKIKKECYNTHRYSIIKLLDCNLEELENIRGDEMMERVVKEAKYLNEDSEFVKYMDAEEEARIWNNSIATELTRKGIEEGEKNKALTIARNMLKKNTDINFISEVTGLSIKEINKLK